MQRNIADMESDGVYFDPSLKDIVQSQISVLKTEIIVYFLCLGASITRHNPA